MRIIGISGHAGCGKDVCSCVLRNNLPNLNVGPWQGVAFGDKVKTLAAGMMGVSVDFIEEWKRKDTPPPGWEKTVRELLQYIGNGMRMFDCDVWVRHLFKGLKSAHNYVISDVRYENEAVTIANKGGVVIRIWRGQEDTHAMSQNCPSETSLDAWDEELRLAGMKKTGVVPRDRLNKCRFDFLVVNNYPSLAEYTNCIASSVFPFVEDKLKYLV